MLVCNGRGPGRYPDSSGFCISRTTTPLSSRTPASSNPGENTIRIRKLVVEAGSYLFTIYHLRFTALIEDVECLTIFTQGGLVH